MADQYGRPRGAAGSKYPDLPSARLSRRQALRLAAAGGATLALNSHAATGTSTPGTVRQSSPPPTEVNRGGSLVHASFLTYPTWDVHLSAATNIGGYNVAFETLTRYEPVAGEPGRFEIRPGLAESWELPDATTAVFYLRKGVKFHDGSDFNADVAKWNLERIQMHPESFAKERLASLDTVEALDSHSIRLKLKAPSAALLQLLSGSLGSSLAMISKAQMDRLGEDGFAREPSGTGPMRLQQWITDDRATLTAFEDYWDVGVDGRPLPYLDEFVSRFIPDLSVALVEAQAGTVHAVEDIPPKDVATVKNDPNLVYVEYDWTGTQYGILHPNLEGPPFDNADVRRALIHGLNKDAMAKTVGFGVARPSPYPLWLPGNLGYDESIPTFDYDPEKAKELLAGAGYPNGLDFELKFIRRDPDSAIAEFAQQSWVEAGLRAKLNALERLTWIDEMRAGNFEVGMSRTAPIAADPDENRRYTVCGGAGNWNNYCDPDYDRLMAEGISTLDPLVRQQRYRDALALLTQSAAVSAGFSVPPNVVLQENVRGVTPQWGLVQYRSAWLA